MTIRKHLEIHHDCVRKSQDLKKYQKTVLGLFGKKSDICLNSVRILFVTKTSEKKYICPTSPLAQISFQITVCLKVAKTSNVVDFSAVHGSYLKPSQIAIIGGFDLMFLVPLFDWANPVITLIALSD